MHLKKFHAATMADALAQVKVQLGADAVILANRKIKDADGQTVVEVTAAVDTPPAAPSAPATAAVNLAQPAAAPVPHGLAEHLTRHGLQGEVRQKIDSALDAMRQGNTGFSDADTLEMVLGKMIPFAAPATVLPRGKVHVLVGPTGSGKTTTAAKLAINKRLQRYSVGLMSWDYHKVSGFDQLNTFANAMNEQAFLLREEDDFTAASVTLGPRDYIIVDTPGVNAFNPKHLERLRRQLVWMGNDVCVHLVIPATLNAVEMTFLPPALASLNPQSLIFTKLDETTYYGAITNVAAQHGLKVCYVTTGSHVPADIAELDAGALAKKLTTAPHLPWEKTA